MSVSNNRQFSGQAGGFSPTPAGMDALLSAAGKQLGTDPQQLRAQLEKGDVQQLLGRMSPQRSAQIGKLLQNPQQLEQLLRSPQVKKLLDSFGKQH